MDKDNFFEMAKTVQDTYSGGSLQGELYALTKLKAHIQSQIEDVQDRINKHYRTKKYFNKRHGQNQLTFFYQ